jgi:hypothetical protein
LQQLLDSSSKEIFEKSKYKPKIMSDKNKSEIKIVVELDENQVPEKIMDRTQRWRCELEEAKAVMLSVWDSKAKKVCVSICGQKNAQLMK